ncbi:MAG: hypothetical protein AB1555_02710 [Nitrospirota bacterium]
MDWDIVTWGLLIGMAGMVWLMVLATWGADRPPDRAAEAHPDESEGSVAQEPRTGRRLVERRSHAA